MYVHVLYFVTSMAEPVIEPPVGAGYLRLNHRLEFASKDDAAQQFVPKLTKIARRV